jgi:signal transduction histidine kinase
MLDRLAQYNRYLETMAGKLSHELRTPVTVVKSSLENLELYDLDKEAKAYTTRAREGVERLNNILTRMSEATRLEQTIQKEQPTDFDLEKVITSCVKGYEIAKPEQAFELEVIKETDDTTLNIKGAPDLIAQMLDKLISNAISFTDDGKAIIVRLEQQDDKVLLSVLNEGPPLPQEMQESLFDSMVSVRSKKGEQPHLGLGLYIVRLIAEFHEGQASARNRSDVTGAQFTVVLPLSS